MREILSNKQGHFQKPPLNALILILSRGLSSLEGEIWARRRKILNPAFHLEKLKVPFERSRFILFPFSTTLTKICTIPLG